MTALVKETEIRWVKQGSSTIVCLMGKDVVLLASERFIVFVETTRPDKKEIIYNANSEAHGDGIRCLCAHGNLPCFAFSEMCRNPRILLLSYPAFETMKNFECMTSTNYIDLKFSEMEFLVALTGVPDFKIIIWNWRTAEKLYVQETKIQRLNQILRVSPTSPIQILQSTEEDRQLVFWNMNLCYKKTLLHRKTACLPPTSTPPYSFAFGADGDVYFVDSEGRLYSINPETHVYTEQYAFTGTLTPDFIPCVTWYKNGIVFATPAEVLFLRRRSPKGWAKIWTYTPKMPFVKIMASSLRDLLVGVNARNEIMVFKGEAQVECIPIRSFGANFEFVCFVNPIGDFFVTFGNATKMFNLWNKTDGQKVSQMLWTKEKINDLESNPKWPYLVAVTAKGWLYLINAYDPNHLSEMEGINLTENSLDAVRFRHQGSQFCVANMDVGEFFLLKVPIKLEVMAYIKLDLKIVDYVMPDKDINGACLLVVPMSQFCCRSGQSVLLYALDEKKKSFVQTMDVEMPSVVTGILPHPTASKEILCLPHRSRKLFTMNVSTKRVTSEFVSGHQMKFISIQWDGEYLYTFGTDGLVIVKLRDVKTCPTLFCSHHRLAKGVKTLAVDPYAGHAIALGENGDLVCVYLKKIENLERRLEFESLLTTPAYRQFFLVKSKAVEKGGDLPEGEVKPNWLVTRRQELINLEEQYSRKEKQGILEELYDIKEKLCMLLDENLNNPPEMQLPVSAFDLDKTDRRKKLEDAKVEREKEKQFRLANMKILNKLADVIKSNCWESVAVKGREIQGILSSISVPSYALFPEDKIFNAQMVWIVEEKKMEQIFKTGDFFEPWIPRTDSDLEMHVNETFRETTQDVFQTIKTKYDEERTEDEQTHTETDTQLNTLVWSGTSTHNFIEVDPQHCSQFELVTFLQSYHEIHFIQRDIKKVMLWFNKEFTETFQLKEQEMEFVAERNNRFKHIIKELTFFNFSPNICKTQIYDPEWAPEEIPDRIMTVQDEEISAPKYMTESALILAKKKEAEEEKLRQLLLADNFKERALMVMMDGVLEKLWEDEIKKDPPKPKCMAENKDPAAWTEDDLKAVRAYEESLRFLAMERERYRKILEARWASTVVTLKDSVSKFDEKLAKLHLLKLKVESAIGQEILKGLRIRKRCFDNVLLLRKRESIKLELSKNEKKIESMMGELSKLQEMLSECKNVHESLQNKDKNLDKNFKKEFPDYSPVICEQLYKLSKKRPKLLQKAAIYSTVLHDLGKCAVSGAKPEHLPVECIQYLKDLDALDPHSNAPASVNQQSWELLCRLRRTKIETELKIRACAIDLADAEATVAAYQKALKAAKERQSHLQGELQAVWAEKTNGAVNFQVQLVLKKGLVELPLSGQIADFEESVLVTKETLGEVNRAIRKIGQQKIKAMEKAANFRKGIIYKEWEHKKLRMEIEDLKGQLETIEKLQVLKELQAILVARARGFADEKGFLYLENELVKVKERYEKEEIEINRKIDDFSQKILNLNKKNEELNKKIVEVNVEVNELNLGRDVDFDKKYFAENMRRMKQVRERGNLVRKIQDQHNEILLLQTELELLRLKTYPTIKYKIS